MIEWSMKLTSDQLRLMRTVADAEIEGEQFKSGSPWHPVFHTLVRRGILKGKPTGKMRGKDHGAREHVYVLTELGATLLSVVDMEIEAIGQVIDFGREKEE